MGETNVIAEVSSASATLIVGVVAASVSFAGILLQQWNRWRQRRDAANAAALKAAETPDKAVARLGQALDRVQKQADDAAKQLDNVQADNAQLRAKLQELWDDNDRLMAENRDYRRTIEELRIANEQQRKKS